MMILKCFFSLIRKHCSTAFNAVNKAICSPDCLSVRPVIVRADPKAVAPLGGAGICAAESLRRDAFRASPYIPDKSLK
eukprot:6201277-Pleurochrysis_carterae.AAC.3